MDILRPKEDKLKIYPLFHFIPGDPLFLGASRVDRRIRPCNTTPNSLNANRIFDAIAASRDLYAMGISTHAYVDTWAHQNFVGYTDPFNALDDWVSKIIPDVGNADAQHDPDWIGLIWKDERLSVPAVNNRDRLLDAAEHLFRKLRNFSDSTCSEAVANSDAQELRRDLDSAIGPQDDENQLRDARIVSYRELALSRLYGESDIPEYKKGEWFSAAVKSKIRNGNPKRPGWKKKIVYRFWGDYSNSDWFRFQEAVKRYADIAGEILNTTLRDIDWKRYDGVWRI